MNKLIRIEQLRIIKRIIEKGKNYLTSGQIISLINLSARAELNLKNNIKNDEARTVDIEIEEIINKYRQFSK